MQKTKIEWTDYVWNPIKGLCPNDCWYCYARKIYERFGWNTEMKLDGELFGSCQDAFAPNIKVYEKLERIKSGSKIFVCSTFELFHPEVPKEWGDAIFQAIKEHPQHIFQILTKFPQNIDRPMPDNVWLGCSIENNNDWARVHSLEDSIAKIRFVSLEPFLYFENFSWDYMNTCKIHWMIIGRLTGYGRKYDPMKIALEHMVKKLRKYNIPIFLKNNLKEIWGENLIQEFPCVA